MKSFFKRIDYRHYICSSLTVGFLLLWFVFPNAVGRVIESVRDFGLSVAFYFCEMFFIPHSIVPTVTELSVYKATIFLPFTWEEFVEKWGVYWQTWATWDNLKAYFLLVGDKLVDFCKFLVVAMPLFIFVYIVFVNVLGKENNDYNKESKALIKFKWFVAHSFTPLKDWLISFFFFVKEHKAYLITWLVTWLLWFNGFSVLFEVFAFYFYFIVDFDLSSIYRQFFKLLCDLATPITFIPVAVWLVIGFIVFDHIRKKIAYRILNHNEMKDRGFINERPIVFMVCGTMGKKKTTVITDMALSQEAMFRDKALEMLIRNDLKFPNFPWINLENELKRAIRFHQVYNLATVKVWTAKKAFRFSKRISRKKIFDYDFVRYGLEYDDNLKIENVWEVIETYSQLYFLYVIQSSLILANYSIRTDNIMSDKGNFPLWNTDFFKRDSRTAVEVSRHSHILDFDTLRLGLKVLEDNPNSDNFEFGVINITEIGKERGNVLELADKLKKANTANQKNDLFNSWLKMVRHSATIDNFPFVRVITDEQRPESWGLDARALCEIVSIENSGEKLLAMPFFTVGEILYDFVFGKFVDLYLQYRFKRGDNTLMMYLLKNFTSLIVRYYSRIYNNFGYCPLDIQVESGTQDGAVIGKKYYLSNKKIYSNRFSTDCFSGFFTEKALRSPVGLNDLREYATEKADMDELQAQNSYFINDLIRTFENNK